jgi:hypothetical protein
MGLGDDGDVGLAVGLVGEGVGGDVGLDRRHDGVLVVVAE